MLPISTEYSPSIPYMPPRGNGGLRNELLTQDAAREKKNAVTAHDDAIATKFTVQFAATWRDLMRNKL